MITYIDCSIFDEDWDYLIVLDACRYDYFKKIYRLFFEGELRRFFSPGSCTAEWFRHTFTSKYPDVVYISANPYINSFMIVGGCDAGRRFYKVLDVWLSGWDYDLGTVPPRTVNTILNEVSNYYSDKRVIVHYLQPHAPYLSPKYFISGFPEPSLREGKVLMGIARRPVERSSIEKIEKMLKMIEFISNKLRLGNGLYLNLRWSLGLQPISPMDATLRVYGVNGLRRAYFENLLIVVETLTYVLDGLDGKVVITSDHGEFLGERNSFSHPCGSKDTILRSVPYLEVKRVLKPSRPRFSLYPLKLKLKLAKRRLEYAKKLP